MECPITVDECPQKFGTELYRFVEFYSPRILVNSAMFGVSI